MANYSRALIFLFFAHLAHAATHTGTYTMPVGGWNSSGQPVVFQWSYDTVTTRYTVVCESGPASGWNGSVSLRLESSAYSYYGQSFTASPGAVRVGLYQFTTATWLDGHHIVLPLGGPTQTPSVVISPTTAELGRGQSVQFVATGASGYVWESDLSNTSTFSVSGSVATLSISTAQLYGNSFYVRVRSDADGSPWVTAAVSVVELPKSHSLTLPANNTNRPRKYEVLQGSNVIATYEQPEGGPAYVFNFQYMESAGAVTLRLTEQGVFYNELTGAYEGGDTLEAIVVQAPLPNTGSIISPPTQAPNKPPDSLVKPPPAVNANTGTRNLNPTGSGAPTSVWNNKTAATTTEEQSKMQAEGFQKVVDELKKLNEREETRDGAAQDMMDKQQAAAVAAATAAHGSFIGSVNSAGDDMGEALTVSRGMDYPGAYTPAAPTSGPFVVKTPFWGNKSINPFATSGRFGSNDASGRDWSAFADVVKAIIAWSTIFWLFYTILGEFRVAVMDMFKVAPAPGEGTAVSVLLNQSVFGVNAALLAIPAKIALIALGLAIWATLPTLLLAGIDDALTFTFSASGTQSLVDAMTGGPSWLSELFGLVNKVVPVSTLVGAAGTHVAMRSGLITAQGTMAVVVRYMSSMG